MAIQNLLLAGRATLLDPNLVEGEVVPFSVNNEGRLRVATKPGQFPPVSADLVALNSALAVDVTDASNILAHIKNTGTVQMSAGNFAFEGSVDSTNGVDGTWFSIQAVRSNANVPETTTPTIVIVAGTGLAWAWEASVNALRWVRIRCSVVVTASAIARWTIVRGSYATEPIPAIQTHAVTGQGLFSIVPGSASAYSAVSVAGTNAAVVKATAGTVMELSVFNPTAALVYVKFFNKAALAVPGTDVPSLVVPVPANANVALEFGLMGKRFTLGIGVAIVAGPASTDAVAVAAGVIVSASFV